MIRIVREMKEYILYCIQGHLGKVDLIIQSCHNNKWKEALSHCTKIIYLDNNNIWAYCKKAILYWKLNQKNKATQTAQYALKLANKYDIQHPSIPSPKQHRSSKHVNKQSIVKNNLYMIFKQTQNDNNNNNNNIRFS